MRLYDEIFKNADGAACARCILLPGGGGYFEGVKYVEEFSSQRIVVCFPRKTVEAEGVNLSIKKYCDGDLQIDGKIACLRVLGEQSSQLTNQRANQHADGKTDEKPNATNGARQAKNGKGA